MQLFSKTIGSGPPMIILHGLLGMSDNWYSFAKEVSGQFTVILVDLRNHGRSPHADLMSYPEMGEDIRHLMEHSWLYDGTIVLGHSMGGKVAMQVASDYPDWVNQLIVVDIAPKRYEPAHLEIIKALKDVDVTRVRSRIAIQDQLTTALGNTTVVAFLMKNLARTSDGFKWKMHLSAIDQHYPTLLDAPEVNSEHIDIPTLFIKGEKSNYLDLHDASLIETMFSDFEIREIPGAGHWVHADQPEIFRKEVLDWLAK